MKSSVRFKPLCFTMCLTKKSIDLNRDWNQWFKSHWFKSANPAPVSVLVWHMMAWWLLAHNNIQSGTSQPQGRFLHLHRRRTDCSSSARVNTRHHCLTTIDNACQLWAMTATVKWCPIIQENGCQTPRGRVETPDSSTMRTTRNSSSLLGICRPTLALLDGLIITPTTTTTTKWS